MTQSYAYICKCTLYIQYLKVSRYVLCHASKLYWTWNSGTHRLIRKYLVYYGVVYCKVSLCVLCRVPPPPTPTPPPHPSVGDTSPADVTAHYFHLNILVNLRMTLLALLPLFLVNKQGTQFSFQKEEILKIKDQL